MQPGATEWPSDAIERNVKPTEAQRASLTALQQAATKAADILQASCPPAEARTPPARLDAARRPHQCDAAGDRHRASGAG